MPGGVSLLFLARIASAWDTTSLDAPIPGADAAGAPSWAERLADDRPRQDAVVDAAYRRQLIARGLRGLHARNGLVVALRLAGWSCSEIALAIDLPPTRVGALERTAHQRMREALTAQGRR